MAEEEILLLFDRMPPHYIARPVWSTCLFGNLEYMSIGSFRVELHSVATAVFLGRIMVMIRLPVTIGRCLSN